MAQKSALITVMTNAVFKAARGLKRDFGEVEHLQVSVKGPANFVSSADLKAEETLMYELSKARPSYGFIAEESGEKKGEDDRFHWIIDPLDGTTNFLHSVPYFAITVALKKDNEIVAGVTYDPLRDELFWAEKGTGAYLNGRRLRVSSRRKLEDSSIATGFAYPENRGEKDVEEFLKLQKSVGDVRIMGSAALDLAYVAAGRFEGYLERNLKPWDIAAGMLLVSEAGGFVTTPENKKDMLEKGTIFAANSHVHGPVLKALR